MMLKLLILD